ncbi:hypothetical protein OR221_0008, partial [Microbacterium laevaniformans OR221]
MWALEGYRISSLFGDMLFYFPTDSCVLLFDLSQVAV